MYSIDPYLAERTMEHRVHEAQREAEVDRLQNQGNAAPLGNLVELSRRLLRTTGGAFSTLGSWLEQPGLAGEQPSEGQAKPKA